MPRGLSGGQRLENKSSLTEVKSAITSWFGDFEKSCCLNDTTVNLQHTGGGIGFNASTVCLDSGSLSSNCSQFRWRHPPARVHTHTHTNKHVGISREDCFLRLCAKSLGETSTVVFHRLRFNPEVVCVLAYLLLSLPLFHSFSPHCVFFRHNVRTPQESPGFM